ncbi:hypothetical protein EDC96DRAFT_575137 [Choanephora cucurbitarum]|nr:hypothetical protein EDC96DRAFT_575137 [Choanephora cucurbitarum]
MRLRIRHPEGTATLSVSNPEQTVGELKQEIKATLNIDKAIELSGGYPPKIIENDSLKLSDGNIRNGDTLSVRLLDSDHSKESIVHKNAVQTSDGFLTLREMKDDNSCLFRSVEEEYLLRFIYQLFPCFTNSYVALKEAEVAHELRQIVAQAISSDEINYSDAMLGMERSQYIEWIQKPNSWGGAIELAILSAYFDLEINSIDVQSGRMDRFGEGKSKERAFVVYSGIHYDAIAMNPQFNGPKELDETRFSLDNEHVVEAAKKLIGDLRKNHKYTDVANFTLRCEQCQKGLKGQKDAQDHAAATGHMRFTEYE